MTIHSAGYNIDIPRRCDRDRFTRAERAISSAMEAVESAGADPRLTAAVTLLSDARDRVADFVDDVPSPAPSAFQRIAGEIGKLLELKNAAYGSSFARSGEFLKLLYPDGLRPEQFTDALLLVRIFDKMMRIANRKDAFAESPYRDLAGYGILGAAKDEERK